MQEEIVSFSQPLSPFGVDVAFINVGLPWKDQSNYIDELMLNVLRCHLTY